MRKITMLLIAASLTVAPAAAETLTNQTIVGLTSAGLGDEAIIAKIQASSNQFDLSTEQMIDLKSKGVSGAVIAAMITAANGAVVSANAAMSSDSPDPLVPHSSGIYLLASDAQPARMVRIDPTTSNQTKADGFIGYALTGGIASINMKAVLPGATARVRTGGGRATFYFYFDEAGRNLSQSGNALWQVGSAAAVTSPNEFSLVRFNVRKNAREAKVGKFNIGGAKAGVMDKDRIPFSYTEVTRGVFKVTPDQELAPGEYGFLYSIGAGTGIGMHAASSTSRVFDFAVTQ